MRASKTKTAAIHAGSAVPHSKAMAISPPIYAASVSYFESAEDLDRSLDGADFVYARNRSQNAELLEEAIASLERADACAVFSSGMAALKAVLDVQRLSAGDRVVMPFDGYGTTRALYKGLLAARGVELHALALAEPEAAAKIIALRPKFVLAESITNPLISVSDLRALSCSCREVGAALAVDATFASPILQRPLELGADYSIHSTTKWINGHGDAMGGAVSGNRERIQELKGSRVLSGGFGGMLAFQLRGAGRSGVFRFLESLKLAKPAPSLGDVATLVMHAATASARRLSQAERDAAGIGENLIRVSVGLEDPDDIADDLLAAIPRAVEP